MRIERCNSPRPETLNVSGLSVSSTRKLTFVSVSLYKRSRKWRDVTNWPSRPANGLVLTPKVMDNVGSSILMLGKASGFSASATVWPILALGRPVIATISPSSASLTSIRFKPW